MKIAVCSDEPYPIHLVIMDELKKRGHEVVSFGSCKTNQECSCAIAGEEAALAISNGTCDEGIFFCWTGTGVSITANKVPGIRAALCIDPETAEGARIWNHANVLALSNRSLKPEMALKILSAWFDSPIGDKGKALVAELNNVDAHYRKK
jgi:ribose 5-phosphate isomerase B